LRLISIPDPRSDSRPTISKKKKKEKKRKKKKKKGEERKEVFHLGESYIICARVRVLTSRKYH
jgi:hypothetical protein